MPIDFSYIAESAATLQRFATDMRYEALFTQATEILWKSLSSGGRVLFAGNGGSAADCQHLAGELVVRFRIDRPAMAGIALTVDTSVLTAALNDYGPDPVFSRQVEALGRPGDVLWVFSTSGKSKNILLACEAAKKIGMKVIGFTGQDGGSLPACCDLCFHAPSAITSHIQECHIAAGHMLCGILEERFAAKK